MDICGGSLRDFCSNLLFFIYVDRHAGRRCGNPSCSEDNTSGFLLNAPAIFDLWCGIRNLNPDLYPPELRKISRESQNAYGAEDGT